ncbi:DUF2712 domain-containing protein [Peribacillus frigoritolerans]|uniref:DUF2712 domain-containing protein n=1 Tax=Peribacillus frigoritolerans TaxID=450367 RepID=A0AAJ1VFX8_9BACI|nr:DUF2712 domain-containing protein [Peribacillus frigoritolerans]MDM5287218.1 DUF2712 domain-containing protein [Peribacillus frigoritolerans]
MTISRKSNFLMYVLIIVSIFSIGSSVFAANNTGDDKSFRFTVPASSNPDKGTTYDNGYSQTQSRSTAEKNAPWYLNLAYSSEGAGTITTMWLAKGSTAYSVANKYYQGKKYTIKVKSGVSGSVRIGAENNNLTSKSHKVEGYWDPAVR